MTAADLEDTAVLVCDCPVSRCWSQAVTAPTPHDAERLAEAAGWTWTGDRWICNYCTTNHQGSI